MIKYSLICNKCDLTFESWFASSNEFEKLKKRKFLNCHNCGSLDVKKSLMAPSLINNKKNQNYEKDTKKLNKIKNRDLKYQVNVVATMLGRAKKHPNKTKEMNAAIKVFNKWMKNYKKVKL